METFTEFIDSFIPSDAMETPATKPRPAPTGPIKVPQLKRTKGKLAPKKLMEEAAAEIENVIDAFDQEPEKKKGKYEGTQPMLGAGQEYEKMIEHMKKKAKKTETKGDTKVKGEAEIKGETEVKAKGEAKEWTPVVIRPCIKMNVFVGMDDEQLVKVTSNFSSSD